MPFHLYKFRPAVYTVFVARIRKDWESALAFGSGRDHQFNILFLVLKKTFLFVLISLLCLILIVGCGAASGSSGTARDSTPKVLVPEAPGKDARGDSTVSVDVSNISDGYFVVKYNGSNADPRMLLTPQGSDYIQYTLRGGQDEVFVLPNGDGTYQIQILENVSGDQFTPIFETSVDVKLTDAYQPFLYPNQYAWFTANSKAVATAQEVVSGAASDVQAVEKVYNYVVTNVSYDYDKAKTIQSQTGYLPDVDATLASKKGICFDYAALATAMLRSQGIPTQLVIGYAKDVLHAWVNVYTPETGWINKAIEFKGSDWVRLDPTFASSSGDNKYVGDGTTYHPTGYY